MVPAIDRERLLAAASSATQAVTRAAQAAAAAGRDGRARAAHCVHGYGDANADARHGTAYPYDCHARLSAARSNRSTSKLVYRACAHVLGSRLFLPIQSWRCAKAAL